MKYNNTLYFYVTNLQGDVTAIMNSSGTVVVEYTYDAWGYIRNTTGTMATTLGKANALRYRSYVYDTETGLYYLQSRYYNPGTGRFINADVMVTIGQGVVGHNVFAYCGNCPITREDTDGNAAETIWDIISLGASLVGVAANPTDPWAWASLIGDMIDVAIPFVGGTGEIIRGFKAVADTIHAAETAHDLLQLTQNSLKAVKEVSNTLPKGNTCVYVAYANDTLEYVGITNDFNRRHREWEGVREIYQITDYVDRTNAHYIEQSLIAAFGKGENGVLSNIRNSIGTKGTRFEGFVDFFRKLT